jgi:uncharacterized protein
MKQTKSITIGIDIDATLTVADYWVPWVNEHYQLNLKAEDVTEYEIEKILGISEADFWQMYDLHGEVLHADSAVRIEAPEVLKRLYKDHELHYITARHSRMKEVTEEWLLRHEIPHHGLHLLGSHDKVETAHQLGCQVFVEDRYENATAIAASGIEVLLMDCYYNRKLPLMDNMQRVADWKHAETIIRDLGKII